MGPEDELALLLRPAGGGVYLVSTGKSEQLALQKRLYDARDEAGVDRRFRAGIANLQDARGFVLGIPSDVGAGFRRGANLGPLEVRLALQDALPDWPERLAGNGFIDLGDVFVVPQLLADDMLSDAQLERTRAAIYPDVPKSERDALPVSPLSIAERVFDLVFAMAPNAKPFVIGGDHSTAWPGVAAMARARKDRWAILQFDAHTDLLADRLGIRMCFATWSYHANELFGRDGRMVQVGTRASRHERQHWESTLGVRQFWAETCRAAPERALDDIMAHLRSVGAESVYISNDIDGTDAEFAEATGTPEPAGLTPEFVLALIRRCGQEMNVIGGDLMEVAPPIQDTDGAKRRTLALSVRYVRETLSALVGKSV